MRPFYTIILVFCLNFCFAQSPFEGKIELKMSTSEKPDMGTTTMYFSAIGGRLETEMKFGPNLKPFKSIRIYKTIKPHLYYVLNESAETFSIVDLTGFKPIEKEEQEVKIKFLGTEKLHGLTCAHILISTKSGDTEMWTTKELMDYTAYTNLNESDVRARNSSFAKALIAAKAEGFPVKTLKKNSRGTTITIEIVNIEKNPVPPTLFEVPNGYIMTESPSSGLEGVIQEIKQVNEDAVKVD